MHLQVKRRAAGGLEALLLRTKRVSAGRQSGKGVKAGIIGERVTRGAGGGVGDDDFYAGNLRARGVADFTGDVAEGLGG